MLGRCVSRKAPAPAASMAWRSRFNRVLAVVGMKKGGNRGLLPGHPYVEGYCTLRGSARQNARSDEEHQLLGRHVNGCVLEQIADQWNAAKERHLIDRGRLVINHDAANHHRSAVVDDYLGLGRLR